MTGRAASGLGACALAVALASGCGGAAKDSRALAWEGAPKLYVPATLPGDRILSGTVRNTSTTAVSVKVPAVRLLDDDGHRVRASAQFIQTFAHGLIFPDTKPRDEQPLVEQRRIGQQVLLKPGQTTPMLVTWHAPRKQPAKDVDYGPGTLPVPSDSTATRTRG